MTNLRKVGLDYKKKKVRPKLDRQGARKNACKHPVYCNTMTPGDIKIS